ncbi:MAG TPA: thioredoxin family protein [Methylomirabilota bacterium]|nr:thioredoxin family protein [Methylomirabilota bacterium]
MALSTRMAIESDRVTTDVIMVNLFPYLAIRHQVDNVPTTVVNGRDKLVGPLDEAQYVARILTAAVPGGG